ncbi:MAG: 50S ribosomal protein L29 [Patescibacteria group bacterium]
MKTLEELKKTDTKKLQEELQLAEKDLFKYTYDVKNGQSKNTHQVRNYKKYIARIKTIDTERSKVS